MNAVIDLRSGDLITENANRISDWVSVRERPVLAWHCDSATGRPVASWVMRPVVAVRLS